MMTYKTLLLLLTLSVGKCMPNENDRSVDLEHMVDLDEKFRLLWRIQGPDIIIELQVQTHGYIGFGFARSENIYGADMVVGWIDKHTFFQDRHIPVHSNNGEPVLDHSQDYVLLSGHENKTHTVIRFRRRLNTCDEKYDVPVTNDTMKIVYMYHHDKPKRGSLHHESLPDPELALKPIKSLLLLQRSKFKRLEKKNDERIETFDVRFQKALLSNNTRACSVTQLKSNKRGHIVAFKPIFEPLMAQNYIIHMTVYECKNKHQTNFVDDDSEACSHQQKFQCSSIVATWSRGSQGFVYPDDVGYPIDSNIASLYFLEVHYETFKLITNIADSSGIQFYISSVKRKHDAGLLSIGIQPVWTHIIPPGFRKVTSIGYCTGKCNSGAFSSDGINIVGIQMQTHEMGKSIKVGLVRNGAELNPIAQDHSLDSNYLEYRVLAETVKVLPGDDLMVECSYNSYDKTKLTLGGFEAQQEVCRAMLVYYPRQEQLTSCQSKPKTNYFLKSLNIDKLQNSPPFAIELPVKYAGKTLEEHLKSYDWKQQLDHFERISKTSPIDVVCSGLERKIIEENPVSIKQPFKPLTTFCESFHKQLQLENENTLSNVQQVRSKVLRSSELSILSLSNSSERFNVWSFLILVSIGLSPFLNRRF